MDHGYGQRRIERELRDYQDPPEIGVAHFSDVGRKGSDSRCSGALFRSISTRVLSWPPPNVRPTYA